MSTVTFEQRPVVLYVFSPMCIWCDRNLRNISHLAESLATRYEFVGVVLEPDGVREYLEAHALNWRVITELEPDLRQRYRLGSTPQTIVVARGGEVLHVWSGAFVERTARQVEQVFGIELPGLGGDK